uniref:DUF104 domain-containing protein n=1 Tax=Candidatus Kentrum sp. FM TaxID=2126340 RepID=A0A450SKB5_9GAMM|nr:MAG: Protein of unknown function DUF104 [Candidatus Kentron sp. FM]VFJ54804.1 MAG: Protein of unknown function DUF104 [Candidatus Kentron sp. FM]VFK08902.1 MAG: Protein of unknown function DUF104 [Candidatus Kentron sp. FM]
MPSIAAIYEHGVLRPLEPLTLPENRKVTIRILPEPVADKDDPAIESLVRSGVLTPPRRTGPLPYSKAQRRELADALARYANRTLSEMVIEDRGPW